MSRLGTPTLAKDASVEGCVDVRVELMVMPFVKIWIRRTHAVQGRHAGAWGELMQTGPGAVLPVTGPEAQDDDSGEFILDE
jgi:hypothetical protein